MKKDNNHTDKAVRDGFNLATLVPKSRWSHQLPKFAQTAVSSWRSALHRRLGRASASEERWRKFDVMVDVVVWGVARWMLARPLVLQFARRLS